MSKQAKTPPELALRGAALRGRCAPYLVIE